MRRADASAALPANAPSVAITLDLHAGDSVDDIRLTSSELRARSIAGTFFTPSGMLADQRYVRAVRDLVSDGHEVASHSHAHDVIEMQALMHGTARDLGFLSLSRRIHEEELGCRPMAFRSPAWCHLNDAARRVLVDLGYRIDSSATPQRAGLLSSTPFENVWTLSPRRLHYIAPSLLEVPMSTLLVPAGSPTFSIFRSAASRALVGLLALEAHLLPARVLTLQFHVHAFNRNSTSRYSRPSKLRWDAFIPRRDGGLAFKQFLRSNDGKSTARLTGRVLDAVRDFRFVTMSNVLTDVTAGRFPGVRPVTRKRAPR